MRVLITRAQPQADATALLVESMGYQPVVAPLTQVIALERGLEQVRQLPADATRVVVATSARAVQILLDAGLLAFVIAERWAVVGQRAADLLTSVGAKLAGEPAQDVRGLISALPADQSLIYLCAQDRKPVLEDSVRFVAVIPVYEARAVGGFDEKTVLDLRTNGVDGAMIFSPRGAELLVDALSKAGLSHLLTATQWFCLSADISQAFSASSQHSVNGPMPHLMVSRVPRQDALLNLLDQHFKSSET